MRFVDVEALADKGKLLELLYFGAGDETLLPEILTRYRLFQRAIRKCMELLRENLWAEFVQPKVAFGPDDLVRCRLGIWRMLHRNDYLALGDWGSIDHALKSDLGHLPEYLDRLVVVAKAGVAINELADANLHGVAIPKDRFASQFKTPFIADVPRGARWPLSAADKKNLAERGFKRRGKSWTRCLKVAPKLLVFDEVTHPDDCENFYDEEGNQLPDSVELPAR